jgi:hypothetical protein
MSTQVRTPFISTPTPLQERPSEADAEAKKWQPVARWAILGGLMLAFMAYVIIKWITGPDFKSVPVGHTSPSDTMKIGEIAFWALSLIGDGCLIYYMLIRPWRRERRISTNGLFLICFAVMYFQDPLGDAGGYWFTYNSWIPNMGSWASSIPSWLPFARPGHSLVEPFIMMMPGYLYFFMAPTVLGLWVMRKVRARWSWAGLGTQFAAVFGVMCVFDFVAEGLIWMPLGFYVYPSAPGPKLWAGSYHQFPVIEMPLIACLLTSIIALRYFTDDKGHTIAERGIDKIRTSPARKGALRLLALIAATQIVFFISYNMLTYQIGIHSRNWPASIQKRSYFLDGLCGQGTPRACPTQSVPQAQGKGNEISISPYGKVVVPPGATLPTKPVPLIAKG